MTGAVHAEPKSEIVVVQDAKDLTKSYKKAGEDSSYVSCPFRIGKAGIEHRELGIGNRRGAGRAGGAQGIHAALAPGAAPAFHRPHTHPQVLRDHRGLLTRREPLAGLEPDPLPKRPTLSGQAPTIRIPHPTGIPQGS